MLGGLDWSLALERGGPWAVIFSLLVFMFLGVQRELFFTRGAHFREIAAKEREIRSREEQLKANNEAHQKAIVLLQTASERAIETARTAAESAVQRLETAHVKYIDMMLVRTDKEAEGIRSDSRDWREAYYLAVKVNAAHEDRQDEILEAIRLILARSGRYDEILESVKQAIATLVEAREMS